jgi:hypothetical protein
MRIISVVMALLLVAGCSGDQDPGPGGTAGTSATAAPAGTGGTGGPGETGGPGATGRPGESRLSAACTDFYAQSQAFALSDTREVDAIADLAKPVRGMAFAEPAYNTCETRATDHAADGVSGFARNDYSRRQAFNADSSQHIVYSLDGFWHLYDAQTHAHLKALAGPAGDAEPQWHPTDPDLLYYLPTNGVGMTVMELTVSTDTSRVVGDLSARLKEKWASASVAWTKSEGSPSKDARFWCFMVEDADFGSLGVITWDRDTDTIVGSMDTNGERPDHLSMSPSGEYCVVSSDGPDGTSAYSRDFSQRTQLLHKSEHSDIAIDANGDDVFVAVDYQSDAGDIFMVNIRTGVRTMLLPSYLNGSETALHISGKAFNKPGWVVLSTYADRSGDRQWFHRKVMAVELTADPTIYNLAFTHNADNGYWTEPHASVNRDFTKVLFNSNWGTGSDTDVDAYMVEIPSDALE